MSDAVHKPISQREYTKNVDSRSRMEQVANELRRRCSLDASKSGNGEGNRVSLYEEALVAAIV